ncbi:MAG TPA: hypothetical protein VMS55_03635 [Myxococcota bacterium]|nr:hypothetical protein [Myxococcota bacterium]
MRPFAAPFSGEELMDAESFSEVYARTGRSEWRRVEPQPTPDSDPPIVDLADLGARVVIDPPPAARGSERLAAGALISPGASAALEAEIDRSHSREAVARLAVYLARSYASAAALLLVRRDMIEGLCGEGLAGRPDAVLFPAGAASVFGEVAGSGRPFRGAPPAQGLDARVLRALGREHVQEIAVLPVRVAGRTVNLLYADNGPESLGDASAAALGAICARVGDAYERLIRERKSNS